jgi:PleD family two-component response regulator
MSVLRGICTMSTESKGKVLFADDDKEGMEEMLDLFASSGFETIGAQDGEQAISKARAFSPDVILLDVKMPGIDGFETCRRLKALKETSEIPVIFITGLSRTQDKLCGFEAGGVDYITKPFEVEETFARVNTHVMLHKLKVEREDIIRELTDTLAIVKKLEGMLPICMYCKKIRNDKGYWEQVDQYITDHSDLKFSHGLCEDCSKKHYPELYGEKLVQESRHNL